MTKAYIYTLKDPQTNQIHYVGQTVNPDHRLLSHLCEYGNKDKRDWIDGLLLGSMRPIMEIIEECQWEDADSREVFWINQLSSHPLLNVLHTKEDMVTIRYTLDIEDWKALKHLSIEKEVSVSTLVCQVIQDYLEEVKDDHRAKNHNP